MKAHREQYTLIFGVFIGLLIGFLLGIYNQKIYKQENKLLKEKIYLLENYTIESP